MISLLLTTVWAVFYTWLDRMGRLLYLAGPDGPSSIPGWAGWAVFYTWLDRMGRLLYLAGPDGPSSIPGWAGWAVFYTWLGRMGRLLYLAGPGGPSTLPGWAGWAGHVISVLVFLEDSPAGGVVTRPAGMGGNVHWPA